MDTQSKNVLNKAINSLRKIYVSGYFIEAKSLDIEEYVEALSLQRKINEIISSGGKKDDFINFLRNWYSLHREGLKKYKKIKGIKDLKKSTCSFLLDLNTDKITKDHFNKKFVLKSYSKHRTKRIWENQLSVDDKKKILNILDKIPKEQDRILWKRALVYELTRKGYYEPKKNKVYKENFFINNEFKDEDKCFAYKILTMDMEEIKDVDINNYKLNFSWNNSEDLYSIWEKLTIEEKDDITNRMNLIPDTSTSHDDKIKVKMMLVDFKYKRNKFNFQEK